MLFGSANPGEGKTTTVANLAASLAQNGARVLAVDADLRRPTLHRHFGLDHTPGSPTWWWGGSKRPRWCVPRPCAGLSVLPCGYIPPNPAELLGSDALRETLHSLRKKYDWVLVDAPPILAMADTPVLCPFVDGLVLVVWSESSSRPALRRALDQVERVGGKLTGRRAQQGRPAAQRLLLRPALRRVLPQVLRRVRRTLRPSHRALVVEHMIG